MAVKLTEAHMQRAMIPVRFYDVQFSRVSAKCAVREQLQNYRANIGECISKGFGLYIWSSKYGTGKTSIAVLMLKAAMRRGYTALFIDAPTLKIALARDVDYDGQVSLSQRAKTVDLLVIDDLGKEYMSGNGFTEKAVEGFLRERIQHTKATIITSNIHPSELKNIYSESMLSLFKECMTAFEISEFDWRSAKENELKDILEGRKKHEC